MPCRAWTPRYAGLIVLGAALVFVAMLAAAPAVSAAYPGQNGKFVWEQGGCPNCGLVLVDRNGSTRITTAGVVGPQGQQLDRSDNFARLSPDGQWVAFQRREYRHNFTEGTGTPDPGLYLVRVDGTGLRKLFGHTDSYSDATKPTWSRDGARIAFSTMSGEIVVVNATGPPDPHVVTATATGSGLSVFRPVWSPSDDVLAVEYLRGSSKGIGLLDADATQSSELTPLTTHGASAYGGYFEPSWSPDGQRIAFTHGELDTTINKGTSRIETIHRNGTDQRALFAFPQGENEPAGASYAGIPLWSPDGEWIVWKLVVGASAKWEGAHPDGSGRNNIAIDGGDADWGPCSAGCASLIPTPPDADGDGVPDASDHCPGQSGPASNNGCPVPPPPPDSDSDGIPDASDSCPAQAGPASNNGCPVVPPDGDGDGVPNASDSCPAQAGPASNNGCPVVPPDGDGDGVPNASDSCPTQAGPASNYGCPVSVPPADGDGDGIPNASDSCPTQAGPAANGGCPASVTPADRDHDGVADAVDACPDVAAAGLPYGCPTPLDGQQANGDTTGPTITLPASNRRVVVSRRGVVRFTVGPSAEDGTGVLLLKTAAKVRTSPKARPKALKLGSAPFRTEAGQTVDVMVKLSAQVRTLLRKTRRIRTRATITLRDETGNTTTKQYALSITASKPH